MSAREDWVDGVDDVDAAQLNALGAEINARQPLNADLTALAALTAPATKLAGIATGATANDTDANLKARANHTGTQSADTITDGTTNKAYTATEKTKLGAISGTNTGDQTSVTGNAGTATALQTSRNIDGQAFNGSANITVIAPGTHAATGKTTPVDADELPLVDSAASNVLKKVTFTNLKAALQVGKRPLASFYRAAQGLVSGVTVVAPVSGATAATGGLVRWDALADKVRYVGSAMTAYDATYGCNVQAGLGNTGLAPICIEFYGNPTDFRLHYYSFVKGDVAVMVDEKRALSPVNAYHYNGADGDVTLQITQGSAVHHKYRIWLHNTIFKGISVNTGAKLVATQKGVQLAVIGDSMIVAGIPIDNAVASGVQGMIGAGSTFGEFSQRTGIDVWPMAGAGTGYVNQSSYSTDGPYGSTARVAALAALPALDAILVWGTANDVTSGGSGDAAVVTAAQTLWAAIKTARSTTPLYVAGVERLGPTNTDYNSLNNALKTAATADAHVDGFIDIYNPGFVYGTGKDGSPASDGNADVFLSSDGAHPTHQGAEYWASNLEKLLGGRIMIPAPSNNLW